MALVERFEAGRIADPRPQQSMTATLQIVELDGETYIQIDGYGSAEKRVKGHRSQNVRLSRTAALQLADLIGRTYG